MIPALYQRARSRGVPYIYLATPDAVSLLEELIPVETRGARPCLRWDILGGLRPANLRAEQTWSEWYGQPYNVSHSKALVTLTTAIQLAGAQRLPQDVALLFLYPHRFFDNAVLTALATMRDKLSGCGSTVVFIGPDVELPQEVAPYFLMLSEDTPSDSELAQLIEEQHAAAAASSKSLQPLTAEAEQDAAKALRSLCRFTAEQTAALAMTATGLDNAVLWQRARKTVEQSAGLTFDQQLFTFADLGGMAQMKQFMSSLCQGPDKPDLLVRVDEIEKLLAGNQGDNTGVTQDILGHLLSASQDYGWTGLFLVGVTGCGKSLLTQCVGKEFHIPSINFDIGSVKKPKVGESQAAIRQLTKTLYGLGRKRCFFMLTCNNLDALPPEFRRRFSFGTWYVDLPTPEELRHIWGIQLALHGLDFDGIMLPAAHNWTGAEVSTCCQLAKALNISVTDAAQYVIPTALSDPGHIETLREYANNRLLSVTEPGPYRKDQKVTELPARSKRSMKFI